MPMSPWEYAFYKMVVLSIDTTKEPLKLCRNKSKTVFHDIPCPFGRVWNLDRFVIFDGEPTTLVLTNGTQALDKKTGRKEGLRKNPRKSSLYLYIHCIMAIKEEPKLANCKNKSNLRNHLHASHQHNTQKQTWEKENLRLKCRNRCEIPKCLSDLSAGFLEGGWEHQIFQGDRQNIPVEWS